MYFNTCISNHSVIHNLLVDAKYNYSLTNTVLRGLVLNEKI